MLLLLLYDIVIVNIILVVIITAIGEEWISIENPVVITAYRVNISVYVNLNIINIGDNVAANNVSVYV